MCCSCEGTDECVTVSERSWEMQIAQSTPQLSSLVQWWRNWKYGFFRWTSWYRRAQNTLREQYNGEGGRGPHNRIVTRNMFCSPPSVLYSWRNCDIGEKRAILTRHGTVLTVVLQCEWRGTGTQNGTDKHTKSSHRTALELSHPSPPSMDDTGKCSTPLLWVRFIPHSLPCTRHKF